MQKEELRKALLLEREKQNALEKKEKDIKIRLKLKGFESFKQSKTFFAYISHRGEVDTESIIGEFLGNKKIIVPKIEEEELCLYELSDTSALRPGRFGIREPHNCLPLDALDSVDVALIPGVAFDMQGHRIGFGSGYFDRLLKKMHCTTIGLAYEFQIIDKVPTDHYDVPVDFIITEKRIITPHQ